MPYKYKRGDSPYYYIGFTPNERQLGFKPITTKLKNSKQVDELIIELKAKVKEAKKTGRFLIAKDTLMSEEFKTYCLDRESRGKKFSPLTIENYEIALKHLYEAVGDKPVREYTKQDYYKFIKHLDKTCTQNGKSVYSRRLYAIFNWLKKEKQIPENNFARVQEKQKEFKILTHTEVKKILDYARTTKYYSFIRFVILSAFRKDEAMNVIWSDIAKDSIRVRGKGDKPASIPVLKDMKIFLQSLKRGAKDERLFQLSPDQIYRFWFRCKQKTKINATTHDLRKFTLSEMANAGVPINFVKEYARHEDIKTTLKYYIQADRVKMKSDIDKKIDLGFI